ncbi:MAG: GNAT family N-acetyltransferase [Planctomycetes bacterium]|nr:GNAT family N-acetyltransferase [Planctomycetota bacterium]
MPQTRIIYETQRLLLRQMTPDDAALWHGILSDAQAMRFYPRVYTRDEADEWTAKNLRRYERDGVGLWVAQRRDDRQFVGVCGITIQFIDGVGEHEIGYQMLPAFWRQGYATEAAAGARDYGFTTLGLRRLVSWMGPDNLPSRRVAEKVGMTLEKQTIQATSGKPHVVYAIRPAAGRAEGLW